MNRDLFNNPQSEMRHLVILRRNDFVKKLEVVEIAVL